MGRLALEGGKPVREKFLPYGHQRIDESDIQAVAEALRSDWLTTGPRVSEFERAFADTVGSKFAVAVNSGTAALHAAAFAAGIESGDEVVTTPLTFAATANCVLYQGGRPIFVDVEPSTLAIDPAEVESKITPRTKALIAVDYAGQPCDYDALRTLAHRHRLVLVADACHAFGGSYQGQSVGVLADLNTFSFHPVKHITTGEGGMVTTNDGERALKMNWFRNHGITTDWQQRAEGNNWFYEIVVLGYNYRLSDINCQLGLSQLAKCKRWLVRRREIARRYDAAFAGIAAVTPLTQRPDRESAWHLYVIQLNFDQLRVGRAEIFRALRAENIGVNVHYVPVYWHPYYQRLGYARGLCPRAEAAYERILTLPLFPAMSERDVDDVIEAVNKVCEAYGH